MHSFILRKILVAPDTAWHAPQTCRHLLLASPLLSSRGSWPWSSRHLRGTLDVGWKSSVRGFWHVACIVIHAAHASLTDSWQFIVCTSWLNLPEHDLDFFNSNCYSSDLRNRVWNQHPAGMQSVNWLGHCHQTCECRFLHGHVNQAIHTHIHVAGRPLIAQNGRYAAWNTEPTKESKNLACVLLMAFIP